MDIRTDIIQLITTEQARYYYVVPVELNGEGLTLLISDTVNKEKAARELRLILGRKLKFETTPSHELAEIIDRYYRQQSKGTAPSTSVKIGEQNSSNFLDRLIKEAVNLGSSDIHFEPFENQSRVRLRIDGMLIEKYILDKAEYPGIVNKIKIQANLDIAEKRLPQDGRIVYTKTKGQKKLDIRVSILPTLYGEKVVMRLLSNNAVAVELTKLGFNDLELKSYLEGVRRPNGIVLISGPTGSGKTTTLYATLRMLNKAEKNIITIEDPIEYTMEGINQVQLKESIGLDFPKALRTFLRQDPDIIMVGEIRDKNTASMAIRASLTGHQVFSTIHTNWSWGF